MKVDLKSMIIISILGLSILSGSFYGIQYLNDKTNLDEEQAINIAKSDEDNKNWVIEYRASPTVDFTNDTWMIQFASTTQMGNLLLVSVDDKSEKIIDTNIISIDVNAIFDKTPKFNTGSPVDTIKQKDLRNTPESDLGYFEDEYSDDAYSKYSPYYNDVSDEFIEKATEFVVNLEFINFIDNFTYYVSAYSWSGINYAYLWGWNYNDFNDEYKYINYNLIYDEKSGSSWDFELVSIDSNFIFMSTLNTLDDIKEIIISTMEYNEYINYTINYDTYYLFSYSMENGFLFDLTLYPQYDYGEDKSASDNNNQNSTEYEYIFKFIEFIIDDRTSEILNIWGTDTNQMTEKEVIDLVLTSSNLTQWFEQINNYTIDTYYGGYGYWSVYLSDINDYYSYSYIYINDINSTIEQIYTKISIPAINLEKQMRLITEKLDETKEFFDRVIKYEAYYYYDNYGSWWISYYDTDDWRNMFYLQINDTDLSVMQIRIYLTTPAKMSENEVSKLFLNKGLTEFNEKYDNIEYYIYYNGFGIHYLYAYDTVLLEAWAWGKANDTTGELIEYKENHPDKLPNYEISDVIEVARNTSEYSEFMDSVSVYFEYVYFYKGSWFYYIYGIDESENYYSLSAEINDTDLKIINIWVYSDDGIYDKTIL